MNSGVRKALQAYGQQNLETEVSVANPHRLIVMLFEGAIKSVAMAKIHMQNGIIPEKGAAISKAISIIEEGLRLSLDKEKGGELAENLDALYDYMAVQLLDANIHNRVETLDVVSKLLTELKDAWQSIDVSMQTINDNDPELQQPLVRGHV